MGEELGNYVHQNRSRVFSTSSFGQKILRSRVFSAQISGLRKNSQILGLFYRSRVFSAQISGHRKILRSRVFFYRSRVFSAQISGLRKDSQISGLFCADLGSFLRRSRVSEKILRSRVFFYRSRVFSVQISGLPFFCPPFFSGATTLREMRGAGGPMSDLFL
jgi:hypothetical protein